MRSIGFTTMATIPTKPTVMITSFLLDYLCYNVCDVGCQWFLTRPLVLICPGGGYEFTFDRKAEAIAVQYIARGFHACVLRYSVVPAKFPQSLYELAWSVAYLRKHAAEYGIKPDKIIVAGFSAGGHLAASLGVFWDKDWLAKETELSAEQMKPNRLLLS